MHLNVVLHNETTDKIERVIYIPIDDWVYDTFEDNDKLDEVLEEIAVNYGESLGYYGTQIELSEVEMEGIG